MMSKEPEYSRTSTDLHDWKQCDCAACVMKRKVTGFDPSAQPTPTIFSIGLNAGPKLGDGSPQ